MNEKMPLETLEEKIYFTAYPSAGE